MSWFRSTPGVIEIAQTVVDRCDCNSTLNCNCNCDDQVVFNNIMLMDPPYKIQWDQLHPKPNSEEDMTWDGMTGICPKTGHRVAIWDRHTAFRRQIDPHFCPNATKNWIAMPNGLDREYVWEEWQMACPSNSK